MTTLLLLPPLLLSSLTYRKLVVLPGYSPLPTYVSMLAEAYYSIWQRVSMHKLKFSDLIMFLFDQLYFTNIIQQNIMKNMNKTPI